MPNFQKNIKSCRITGLMVDTPPDAWLKEIGPSVKASTDELCVICMERRRTQCFVFEQWGLGSKIPVKSMKTKGKSRVDLAEDG